VLHETDISVEEGEFLVLVGPSGCGKSTLLNMIAGLEEVTSGEIAIRGRRMNEVKPADRNIAMVFQSYALYPNMTVRGNISFGMEMHGVPKDERERKIADVAELLQIEKFLDRKPGQLSGGQRQRVAMGRALTRDPDVFLFDEPLSNLDAKLRVKMRMELQELHNRLGATSIYVTHDQVEAMTLADRIVIMNGGVVAQVGTPREVYDHPADEFVAGFIGSPAMNFLDLLRDDSGRWISACGGLALPALPFDAGRRRSIRLGIRPEHIRVTAGGAAGQAGTTYEASVLLDELLGADALLSLGIGEVRLLARVGGVGHPGQGDTVAITLDPDQLHAFDPASGAALGRI